MVTHGKSKYDNLTHRGRTAKKVEEQSIYNYRLREYAKSRASHRLFASEYKIKKSFWKEAEPNKDNPLWQR